MENETMERPGPGNAAPRGMMSLRARLLLSVCIAVTFLVTMLVVYYVSFRQMAVAQIHSTFQNAAEEMTESVHVNLAAVEKAARVSGYSTVVQRAMLSLSPIERIQNQGVAYDALDNARAFQDGILNIAFYVDDHNRLFTGNDNRNSHFSNRTVFHEVLEDKRLLELPLRAEPFYSELYYRDEHTPPHVFYYLPVRNVLPAADTRQGAGFVLVMCDVSRLVTLAQRSGMPEGAVALIEDGQVRYATTPPDGATREALLSAPDGISTLQVEGEKRLFYAFDVEHAGWRIAYTITEGSLFSDIFASRNLLFILLFAGALIVLGSILSTLISLSRSIFSVVQDVQSLSGEDSPDPIRLPNVLELAILADQINLMLGRMDALHKARQQSQNRAYSAIIAQQRATMIAYRSQINPHFLFNTLECIRSMAHHYQAGDLEELISSTSRLLEYSLYAESIVPFSEELTQLRSYMRVMAIRYPGRYDFRVDVPDAVLSHPILSMTLQPLAENAVLHGRGGARRSAPLIVCVKAWMDEDRVLWARVVDNGVGIPPDKLKAINDEKRSPDEERQRRKTSIGIDNIYARLKAVDSRCTLRVYSKEGHYTVSELRIPWDIRFPGEVGEKEGDGGTLLSF
ncbi:histidine kinase [Eubacteriales bacterium OttesenSCG-928-A19]|nr:histidine kinase [Eubacteriales bacterium OttesenSCG-928-A19]